MPKIYRLALIAIKNILKLYFIKEQEKSWIINFRFIIFYNVFAKFTYHQDKIYANPF